MQATKALLRGMATGGIFLIAVSCYAGTAPFLSCELSKDGPTVRLYRYAKISDSHRYSIQVGKAARQAVFDSSDEGDRGSAIKSRCVGTGQARALVVQGEFFGAAYPKGFVIVWNPLINEVERVDFAERSFPARIYLSPVGAKVVMPNVGNEAATRYIVYTYDATNRQTETGALNELPVVSSSLLELVVGAR